MSAKGSSNAVIASSKLTRCLERFDVAFRPSQSNLIYSMYRNSTGMSRHKGQTPDLLSQVVEQRLRVLQIARVEAFGEPGVERGEEGAGGSRVRSR